MAAFARAGKPAGKELTELLLLSRLKRQDELDKLGSEVREKNLILKGRGSPDFMRLRTHARNCNLNAGNPAHPPGKEALSSLR